jgi:hypothetical protein
MARHLNGERRDEIAHRDALIRKLADRIASLLLAFTPVVAMLAALVADIEKRRTLAVPGSKEWQDADKAHRQYTKWYDDAATAIRKAQRD